MSLLTKFIECNQVPLDWKTLIKLPIVKDDEGNYYLNLLYTECTDCENLTPAADCVSEITPEELLMNLLVDDECGNPAIALTGNICATCET